MNDELLSALDHALIYNRRAMITLLLKAGSQIDHKKEGCIYYLGHYCNSVLYSLMADNDVHNIDVLIDCGYTVDCALLTCAMVQRYNDNLLATLKRYAEQPRSLYSLCRICIRNTVNQVRASSGRSLEKRLDSLSLPAEVLDYLTLRDVQVAGV